MKGRGGGVNRGETCHKYSGVIVQQATHSASGGNGGRGLGGGVGVGEGGCTSGAVVA